MRRRPVFYLFRLDADEPRPVARFPDRGDAIRAAWAFERLGWTGDVRSRSEGGSEESGAWAHEYRSRLEPRPRRAPAPRRRARTG